SAKDAEPPSKAFIQIFIGFQIERTCRQVIKKPSPCNKLKISISVNDPG
ncbi:2084_t:CDS:1, partial [Dentiscutata heterogama]